MISKKEVQHIAKLARFSLTKKEIEKFQRELSQILDYAEKLKEVNISRVPGYTHSIELENVMREDEAKKEKKEDKNQEKLLNLAPEVEKGYLKVKSVF